MFSDEKGSLTRHVKRRGAGRVKVKKTGKVKVASKVTDDWSQEGTGGTAEVAQPEEEEEEAVLDAIFVCPQCRKPLCRDVSLCAHMHTVHRLEISAELALQYAVSMKDIVLKIKKKNQSHLFKCLRCAGAPGMSRNKMSAHLRVNPSGGLTCKGVCPDGVGLSNWQQIFFLKRKRQYLCHMCGAAFSDKTTFRMHVTSHASGSEVKKWMCQQCPYATNNKFYFNIHMTGQHATEPRERPHVCELCGKTFVFKQVLGQHMKYMHVKDRTYPCPLCPKFFYRPQALSRHRRTHSGLRPWVCQKCGQAFTVKYNLMVHERLHSGEKPYQCKHCDAAFAQKNSLNVHMKKHEGEGGGGEGGGGEFSHSREKPYQCQQCHAVFAKKNGLNVHVKKHKRELEYLQQHSGEKPYKCEQHKGEGGGGVEVWLEEGGYHHPHRSDTKSVAVTTSSSSTFLAAYTSAAVVARETVTLSAAIAAAATTRETTANTTSTSSGVQSFTEREHEDEGFG